jgi:2-polyprenyl-3-methyl-5-hydroxy-6-metoxy-1,4-benzoquinol methylase
LLNDVNAMRYKFLDPESLIGTSDFEFVATFLRDTGSTQIGWHYFVDLAWIYSQAKNWPTSFRILDAGGGRGPTQFLLAELGFNVSNVDLVMTEPAPRIKKRYRMTFESAASYQETTYVDHLTSNSAKTHLLRKLRNVVHSFSLYQNVTAEKYRKIYDQWRNANGITAEVGSLAWMRANLCNVPEIESNTYDAVVSLSALEHIPIDLLPQAWAEISRICKPDVKVAITTSATEQEASWFHQPSQGNCFAESDLEAIFAARPDANNLPANDMLEKYRACTYLKDNLADFYYESGENGMPYGKWDPLYFPVGIFQ